MTYFCEYRSMRNIFKKYYWWFIVPVLMIVLFVLYQEGNLGFSNWKIVKTGSLEIVLPENNVKIFINEIEKNITNPRELNILFKKVPVGLNSVLISKNGYWPWMKKIEISEGKKTIIYPFLTEILQEDITAIDKESNLYKDIKNKIENLFIPTKDHKLVSTNAGASLWVYNKTIFFQKIDSGEVVEVFTGTNQITGVDFYKDRDDVILFSTGNYIYVIETSIKNNQNFQPLFQGENPKFIKKDNQNIYILDKNILAEIKM